MSKVITIRFDPVAFDGLSRHAASRGIKPSVAARDLLRRGLGLVQTDYEAGYAEGQIAAHAEILSRFHGGA